MDKETLELVERLERIHEESNAANKSAQSSLVTCQIIVTVSTVINVGTVFLTRTEVPESLKFLVFISIFIGSLAYFINLK